MAAEAGENLGQGVQLVLDYLKDTPKALGVLVFSLVSGHLWTFILFAYFKANKKGNTILLSLVGRTSLGLCWFAVVMVVVYYFSFNTLNLSYQNILTITIPTLTFGLVLQAFTLLLIFIIKK